MSEILELEQRTRVQLKMRLRRIAVVIDRFRGHLCVRDMEAMDRRIDGLDKWLASAAQRKEIARKAAAKRWGKKAK